MREDFLHYLWKYSLYKTELALADGTPVEVLLAGEHNADAGPDFFNARIKIGNTIWAGNVEIHVNASDWLKHKHQHNVAYDPIILHVVANNDVEIKRSNGEIIPVVELKVKPQLYQQYLYLMQSKLWVPCETFIKNVDAFTILAWKDSLLVERLNEKSAVIEERWLKNNKNWEETFYQTLAANFGFKTNALPFEMLANSIPLQFLAKHKDDLMLIEAMLFGQSGLLSTNPTDAYTQQLAKDYAHLKNKFTLQPMSGHLWKFSKLRPSNFPTLRIAEFAALIHKSNALMSHIIEAKSFTELHQYFQLEASAYWQSHYIFEKQTAKITKHFGETAFHNLIINSIAPFFALYARLKSQPVYAEKAVEWLSQMPAEHNQITNHWQQLGLEVKTAFDSQALIQLKNLYCIQRRCLHCRIGNQVLRHTF